MEEQFVVLPTSTLQALLQEIQGLKDQIKALEDRQNEDNDRLARDIALDRRRITALESNHDKPQPRQLNQSEVLRALLAANGGKMLQLEAIKKMNLPKSDFSRLLRSMKNDIKSKPYYKDRRKNLLELL